MPPRLPTPTRTRRLMRPTDVPGHQARKELRRLAHTLHGKSHAGPVVLAFLGAGASSSAGLPLGKDLKRLLLKRFTGRLSSVLKSEVLREYGDRSGSYEEIVDSLTLFELASVLCRISYCRRILDHTISEELGPKKILRRPLTCELLAHLAKHRFIDHFVVLNFDTLLDEAVFDELPERAHTIASPRDVPASTDDAKDTCFIVRPFGLLSRRPYSISTEDVRRFGPEPIADFIRDQLPRSRTTRKPDIVLLLFGYAAAEPSFASFVRWLSALPGQGRPRKVTLYVVDIAPTIPSELAKLATLRNVRLRYIRCHTDTALEMTLELLHHCRKRDPVWIPAARHFLVSKCLTYAELSNDRKRFRLEVLLQGVKSRGFLHLEAFSHVRRLRRYGGKGARSVIAALLKTHTIVADQWLSSSTPMPSKRQRQYVPNYMIRENGAVVRALWGQRRRPPVGQWELRGFSNGATPKFAFRRIPFARHARRRLAQIETAPEIEIVHDANPEARWILGHRQVTPLKDMNELARRSRQLLVRATTWAEAGRRVRLFGIWSTGEWLFHHKGWAADFGRRLLRMANVEIRLVVTGRGGKRGTRSRRRDEVLKELTRDHKATVAVVEMNWWELNRVLTLAYFGNREGDGRAIYMRRRLGNPLVSPYLVTSRSGLRYLREVWDAYYRRGRLLASNRASRAEASGVHSSRQRPS